LRSEQDVAAYGIYSHDNKESHSPVHRVHLDLYLKAVLAGSALGLDEGCWKRDYFAPCPETQ
jgi:hypothetical protein